MLRRAPKKQQVDDEDVNVTPLLDIVFIMLIFFIVTSTFIKEPGVQVQRPDAETAEEQRLVSILVAVTGENEIWINRELVPMEGVRAAVERIRRENPKGSAVMQVDSAAHSRYMVEVLQRIRDAGVTDVVAVSTKRS
jgi:biopolymer transport protein ExbD